MGIVAILSFEDLILEAKLRDYEKFAGLRLSDPEVLPINVPKV